MRVFLSHSSKDKILVESVANRLGRSFVVYDSFSFETGREFADSIAETLSDSVIFVLFASTKSVTSEWVKLELKEAKLLQVRGNIRKIIVFLIDDLVQIADLPDWLRNARAVRMSSPSQITREIRLHLHQLVQEAQSPIFVGRRKEIETAERLLAPVESFEAPH